MTNLCASLETEHRTIEKVLTAMDRELKTMGAGGSVNVPFFEKAMAFIREFADGLHHQKEEQLLFPRMVEAGVPRDGGPVGVMLQEHEEGRACVRAMKASLEGAAAGDAGKHADLLAAARTYVDLLRAHIAKEDQVLFPMAERFLTATQQEDMLTLFEAAEQVAPARDEAHRAWAEALSG